MKLAYFSNVYPRYAEELEARYPDDGPRSFAQAREAFEADAYGWVGAWGPALAPLGHEVLEVWHNVGFLQSAWGREHGIPGADADAVALAQLRVFAPDVLWFDHWDERLLSRVRQACPSVRGTIGWVGSALPDTPVWRAFDLVLSCASESVETLTARGVRAAQLHHAFQERVLHALGPREPKLALSFVGQLAADAAIHVHRERLLERLLGEVDLAVFSPSHARTPGSPAMRAVKGAAFVIARALERAGVPREALRRWPAIGAAAAWEAPPRGGLNARLQAVLRPGCFGMELFRTLRDSRATLNVHAGSATRFTSNMRLFEATGAGACLLTDAAPNLAELFEPDRDVAVYRSDDECVEKARWLIAHDAEREAMALAGQQRCLAAHTFHHRAPRLDELLRQVVW